jgi:YVTN family beta-propeller protein
MTGCAPDSNPDAAVRSNRYQRWSDHYSRIVSIADIVRGSLMNIESSAAPRAVAAMSALLGLLCFGPPAHAADSAGERLYVSDESGGNVVVVDPVAAKVIATIAVGRRPRGIVISADATRLYVALSGSPNGGPNVDESKLPPPDRRFDGIGVVDLQSHKLINTFPSNADPETFAISHDGKILYTSNEDTGMLSALDLGSGTIRAAVTVGSEPEGVAVSQDDRIVYTACETSNEVYAVDTRTMKVVATIATTARPRSVLLSTRSHTGYVTDEYGGSITVFSTDNYKVLKTIPLGDPKLVRPMGVVASADGRLLYVTTGRAGALLEIDPAAGRILRTIDGVGKRPWGVALSRDGRKAYTANGPAGDISVVDLASGQVENRIAVGGSPWGIVSH